MEPRDFDEKPMRADVTYTYETSKAFRQFHYRNAWKRSLLEIGVSILGFLALPYTSFFGEAFPAIFSVLFSLLAFLGVFSLLVGKGLFFTKRRYKKLLGRNASGEPARHVLTFYRHDFTAVSEREGLHSDSRMRYDQLEKVGETTTGFYLYTGVRQAIGVDKSLLENGSADALRELLKAAVPAKSYDSTVK